MAGINPIRKMKLTGPFRTISGRRVYRRRWVAVCPVCNEILDPGVFGTRKSAKDRLHSHKLRVHAENTA